MKKIILLIAVLILVLLVGCNKKTENNFSSENIKEQESVNQDSKQENIEKESGNVAIDFEKKSGEKFENENNSGENKISKFDLSFLKIENERENKIYSPLSIKYALKMLEEGTDAESKIQISNVIKNLGLTKYESNNNMSFANSIFIRDTFKNQVKLSYIDTLKEKYDAEVIFDSFETVDNINSWVKDKTLNLIDKLIESVNEEEFLLINALGIDMEWKNKFLEGSWEGCHYEHEDFWWSAVEQVTANNFDEDKKSISGMEIKASLNNYDIIEELGEENIREIVSKEYRNWAKNLTEDDWEYDFTFNKDLSNENIEKKLNNYLDGEDMGSYYQEGYISELDSNYGRADYSTDFSLYVDDNVKVFAKDLKEYDGTTLQYVGIMPINEYLDKYIENLTDLKLNQLINNLKELKIENFKEGVLTKITGYIPKFKFEYELTLKDDLKQLGITDVFQRGKANLINICDNEELYITEAKHKANIEFTQDGIKAAAVTMFARCWCWGFF